MKFTVNVLLFGRSGVGKTSLLAAMYSSLQLSPVFENLKVSSDQSHDLDASLHELKRFIRTLAEGKPESAPSTATKKTFTFTIGLHDLDDTLDIVFIDMPGEWLDDPNRKNEWKELIRSSDIIIAVISAPAMMEENREYNEDINKPSRFKEYLDFALEPAATGRGGSKRVFLIPVKCEKYMASKDRLSPVLKAVYHNHLSTIHSHCHYCYGLAVNTLGSVVFERFETLPDGSPKDHYKLKSPGSTEWKPENHDVLVAHILDHCLIKLAHYNRDFAATIKPIREKISSLCKSATGYEIPEKNHIRMSASCFAGDTPVLMADGQYIPIVMLKAGMKVVTMNQSKGFEPQCILKVSKHKHVPLMAVTIGDYTLRVTAGHLFMVGNVWKSAGSLAVGDTITAFQKGALHPATMAVVKISHETVTSDAYNIYVKRNSNYIAGGALVSSYVNFNQSRQIFERLIDRVLENNRRICNVT